MLCVKGGFGMEEVGLNITPKEFTIPFYAISVKQNPKLIALPSIKTKMREYAVWLTN